MILACHNLNKAFGEQLIVKDGSFHIEDREKAAFVGVNGAGKSTFIKVITGVHQPDSGLMLLEGEKITLRSTEDSAKLGIAAIYQHVTAFPDLSVTENIFMGQEIKNKLGIYNWKLMTKRAKELIEPLSKNIDVSKPMSTLSVAQQQLVEIAKALNKNCKILILDEPTSGLDPFSRDELLDLFINLKEHGVTILFSTHITSDLEKCADNIIYIKKGEIKVESRREDFIKNYGLPGESLEEIFLRLEKEERL